MRMQSATHHVLIMLTRCGLERNRGHPHRIRVGQSDHLICSKQSCFESV